MLSSARCRLPGRAYPADALRPAGGKRNGDSQIAVSVVEPIREQIAKRRKNEARDAVYRVMITEIDRGNPQAQNEGAQDQKERLRIAPGVEPHQKRDAHVQAWETIPLDTGEIHEGDLLVENCEW